MHLLISMELQPIFHMLVTFILVQSLERIFVWNNPTKFEAQHLWKDMKYSTAQSAEVLRWNFTETWVVVQHFPTKLREKFTIKSQYHQSSFRNELHSGRWISVDTINIHLLFHNQLIEGHSLERLYKHMNKRNHANLNRKPL